MRLQKTIDTSLHDDHLFWWKGKGGGSGMPNIGEAAESREDSVSNRGESWSSFKFL